jgi:hypothetical protein
MKTTHTTDTVIQMLKTLIGVITQYVQGNQTWEQDGSEYRVDTVVGLAEDIIENGFVHTSDSEGDISYSLDALVTNNGGTVKLDIDRSVVYAEVNGEWTGYIARTFSGDTVAEALGNAIKKKEGVELRLAMAEKAGTKDEVEQELESPVDGAVDRPAPETEVDIPDPAPASAPPESVFAAADDPPEQEVLPVVPSEVEAS